MATSGISGRTGTDGPTPIPPLGARSDDLAFLRFALVGTGRLGIALGSALRLAGAELTGHTARSADGRDRGARCLGMPAEASVRDLAARAAAGDTHLYIVATPDDTISAVAEQLAAALAPAGPGSIAATPDGRATPEPRAVMHTSGATSVDALAPLAALGLTTLSFHPLQTFTDGAGPDRMRGVSVAVTAGPPVRRDAMGLRPDDAAAPSGATGQALGFRLARAVGARPFALREDDRVLYHAAACMASNYLVTLEHLAESLFTRVGLGFEDSDAFSAFLPLVEGTVDNLERHGTVAALTGPISRGDTGTIGRHLQALAAEAPQTLDPYRQMGRATLALVRARGTVPDHTLRELEALFARQSPAVDAAPCTFQALAHRADAPAVASDGTSSAEATPDPGSPPPRRSP